MPTSPEANKGTHNQPLDSPAPPSGLPISAHPMQQPSAQPQDSQIGSVTIFRTAQFFVHAVSHRGTAAARQQNGNTSLLENARWISTERRRVLESETRLLPDVALINPLLQREIIIPAWLEAFVVVLVVGVGMALHAWSMFASPYYQQDEGLLMSDAWAVTHGMIQPYAYTYTQTFLGWIQIAGWLKLTGGPATFGNALNSGRVLMLVFTAASALLLYFITNRLSRSRSAGLLAVALFAFSPLAIPYQREVSLDTIATFWLLLSLYLLVTSASRLFPIVIASIALSIAILTKEVFVIFVPVILYAVWLHVTAFQRKFVFLVFVYVLLSLVSVFALFALLKGELLPTGILPGDNHQHPSIWEGVVNTVLTAQLSSDFHTTWNLWIQHELFFFIAGAVAIALNLLAGWRNPLQTFIALLLASIWVFILLTNIVYTSYLIICLPFMAMNIAIAASALLKWPGKQFGFDLVRVLLIFGFIGILLPYRIQSTQPLTLPNSTAAQVNSLQWIRDNLPVNSTIILDSYLYADLHEPAGPAAKVYPHAQIYWNVVLDPDVRFKELHNDWTKIDYIVVDAQMQQDIRTRTSNMLLLDRALHHATLIQTFKAADNDPSTAVQVYQVIHTVK